MSSICRKVVRKTKWADISISFRKVLSYGKQDVRSLIEDLVIIDTLVYTNIIQELI